MSMCPGGPRFHGVPCLGDATSFVFCPSYGLSKGGGIQRRTICSPRSSLVGSDSDWPWVFEDPGRSTELPEEEAFSGFDGLDDLFAGDVNIHQTDYARFEHSKVSREVWNACHAHVSLDPAPAAKLVALSTAGTALVGLPRHPAQAAINGEDLQHTLQENRLDEAHDSPVDVTGESTAISHDAIADTGHGGRRWAFSDRELQGLALALTGTTLMRGSQPFASCYGGYQFGNWAGQLGDGRVATLGEIRTVRGVQGGPGATRAWNGDLVEIQLKGIGKTPFSRGGDGKAVLGTCLREYLFSEAFVGLGLSAAIATSVCTTGEAALTRDQNPENDGALIRAPGAVLCRIAPSFLRFGSFELPARRGELDTVRSLADYCLRHLGSHLADPAPSAVGGIEKYEGVKSKAALGGCPGPAKSNMLRQGSGYRENTKQGILERSSEDRQRDYLRLLMAIVQATARMVASWQALGFCHGALNTDNFTVLGLGLDFGPCCFMEKYSPSSSPNDGDSALRYAFENQPDVSAWNCERLVEAFSSLIGYSGLAQANEAFSPAFDAAYTSCLQRKLGLVGMELGGGWTAALRSGAVQTRNGTAGVPPDARFVFDLLRLMADSGTDFTHTWRSLIEVPALSVALNSKRNAAFHRRLDQEERIGVDASAFTQVGKVEMGVPDVSFDDWARESTAEILDITDEDCLQPLSTVLKDAKASSQQMLAWVRWTREYMALIDSHGIGRCHPEGPEAGRRERLDIMRNSNPAFVLRESALSQAVKAAEEGDMSFLHQLEQCLATPYSTEGFDQGRTDVSRKTQVA